MKTEFHTCPAVLLLGMIQVILMIWLMNVRLDNRHKEAIIQTEQQRRITMAERVDALKNRAEVLDRQAKEWEAVAKQWEENSNRFERVVRTYEGICGARAKR